MSKGIYQQMLDRANEPQKKLTWKELEKLMNESYKRERKEFKRREKIAKENIKHLNKRSKELNKEIPFILLYRLGTPQIHYVGTDFIKKYKEWL